MLFSSRINAEKKHKGATPQQPGMMKKALRVAFKPEIGSQFNILRESTDIFVNLLAMIFIAQKMFPANHPAYLGINGERLSFKTLIETIWHDLKFTKNSIPQVLMFCALMSGILFSVLAVFVLMLSLFGSVFVGRAHAQGFFTSPAGDDIANQWLTFLRNGSTGSFFTSFAEPLMWVSPLQGALVTALGFYSDAILIVAAVILFYHLAAMTVETAHEGVVMGKKANQIWAPIRLVVAIGLLVPVGGGLNSGQYIVFKVSEWGSGLASNVWSIFLGGFAAGTGVASIPAYAADVVYNTLLSESCQDNLQRADRATTDSHSQAGNAPTENQGGTGGQNTNQKGQTRQNNTGNIQKCGHVATNNSGTGTSPTQQAVQANAQSCYDQLKQQAQPRARQYNDNWQPPTRGGKSDKVTPPYDGGVYQLISDYMQCLADGLPIPNLLGVFALSSEWGWLSAGAVLSAIAQAESDANDLGALIPDVQGPNADGSEDPDLKDALEKTLKTAQYIGALPQGGTGVGGGAAIGSDKCAAQRGQLLEQAAGLQQKGNAQGHFLDRVFEVIDWLASWNCVWVSMPPAFGDGAFSMGIMFIGANPLAEMARLGQACINTAYDAFDLMVNLSATMGKNNATQKAGAKAGGEFAGSVMAETKTLLGAEGAGGALTMVSGILSMITAVFFTTGILLAYYVPLIPFISFLFSALAWVMAVLEAIIAMPLLALAHLTVQGEGLPGQAAKAGYYFLFNIALRPVLMVFGLIVGLIVFYAAVSYMNLFYMMAISTAGGVATSHLFLSRLIYNGLYVIIIYICANASFKAINFLPDNAMKWMGHQSMHFAHMGEPQQVSGPLMQGAGNISQVTGALSSGGWGAAKALQGGEVGNMITGAQAGASHAGRGGASRHITGASNKTAANIPAPTTEKDKGEEEQPKDKA